METCFTEKVHSLPALLVLQRTSALPPSFLPLAERPSSVNLPLAQMSPVPEWKEGLVLWLKSAPGSIWSREHYKLSQKQPRLCHSSTPCEAKEAHSGTAAGWIPGGFSVRNHRLHFLQDLPSQPSSALPSSHDCSTAQGGKQGDWGGCVLLQGAGGARQRQGPAAMPRFAAGWAAQSPPHG